MVRSLDVVRDTMELVHSSVAAEEQSFVVAVGHSHRLELDVGYMARVEVVRLDSFVVGVRWLVDLEMKNSFVQLFSGDAHMT